MRPPLRPLAELAPYTANSRTHTDDQVAELERAMAEFGYTNPVLADARSISAGHGRVRAVANIYARGETLRWPDGEPIPAGMIPCLSCEGWTEAQKRAYVIADNKLALNADWDETVLAAELAAILDADEDLATVIGFSEEELAKLLDDGEGAGGQRREASFSYVEQFGVIVVCADEAAQKAAFEKLQSQGYDCKVVVT